MSLYLSLLWVRLSSCRGCRIQREQLGWLWAAMYIVLLYRLGHKRSNEGLSPGRVHSQALISNPHWLIFLPFQKQEDMVAEDSKWVYEPNVPLAIIGSIVYGVLFIAITHLTFIKYRAWWFTVVVIGSAIEVASYILRAYSAKNQSELVSASLPSLPLEILTLKQVPLVLTLSLVVIAPIFIAAGNYMLISRLILSVLTPDHHRVLRIPGRYLTPIFVTCDIVAALVQGNGSGIAASDEYTGESERIGRWILVGGLLFQLSFFSFFMAVFGRFHWLARNKGLSPTAPVGWDKVVIAVYVSSILIMVSDWFRTRLFSGNRSANRPRSGASIASANLPKG